MYKILIILLPITLAAVDITGAIEDPVVRPPQGGMDLWVVDSQFTDPRPQTKMGVFPEAGNEMWCLENVSSSPFNVYKIDKAGNILKQFSYTSAAYAMDINRIGPNLWISSFYPSPERVYVIDTNGTYIKEIYPSVGGRIRGMDWVGDSIFYYANNVAPSNITFHTMDTLGTVVKTYTGSGLYWIFCIAYDRIDQDALYANDQNYFVYKLALDQGANTYTITETNSHPGGGYPEGLGWDPETNLHLWTNGHQGPYIYRVKIHDVSVEEGNAGKLNDLNLKNTPNPARNWTVVSYQVPRPTHVEITLYDAVGKAVRRLVNSELTAGIHQLKVNTSDLSSGIYFVEMKADGISRAHKLAIMR